MMLISDRGTLVRTRVSEVSRVGRNTQGVTLIRTVDGEHVVGLQRIDEVIEVDSTVIETDEDGNVIEAIARDVDVQVGTTGADAGDDDNSENDNGESSEDEK